MSSVALRLVLAPTLIALASLAGRRWGPTISGWLVGLPLTSGPVVFLLAITYGTSFAAHAALGTLAGVISLTVYSLGYGWTARRFGWPLSVAVGSVAFAVATLALQHVTLALPVLIGSILIALVIALALMPAPARQAPAVVHGAAPRWDLPARMAIAAAFVLLLTGAASLLGPQLTGLVSPFPVYATILAVFTHRQQGGRAAADVLRGMLVGLFAFVAFFLIIAALIERAGVGAAFVAAIVVALLAQGASLWLMRRQRRKLAS